MPPETPHQTAAPDAATLRDVGALFQPFTPAYTADPAGAFYLRAHREAPVAYSEAFSAYLVTGHAEVSHVLREPVRFSSARNLDPMVPLPAEVDEVLKDAQFPLAPGLFNNDPPSHTRARALFSKGFTPARVAELEPRIRAITAERLDAIARAESAVDLMQALAFPLPMNVIAELIGVPAADMPQLRAWQEGYFRAFDPTVPLADKIAAAEGTVAYHRYYLDFIERRRAAPTEDLASALIRARIDGETPFTNAEILSHLIILLFAGYETTASLIGSLVTRLLAEPELWRRVDRDPALLAAVTEETLRLDAPVQMEPRRTTAGASVGGVEIPGDAAVFVFFGAANYDAKVFTSPQAFDLARPSTGRHMGFGWGVHSCLGASLARLETRVAVEMLRERFPSLRFASDAPRSFVPSMLFRTPAAVPVTWDR